MAFSALLQIFPSLLLPVLFHFTSLSCSSAAYTLPQQFFINCGSSSSIYSFRNYTGDDNSPAIAFSSDDSSSVQNSSSSTANQLYQSARIFQQPSTYELRVVENGTYVVRFHFSPFSALGNLSDARFSVEASNFRLLSNLSFSNNNISGFPLIEEFLLTISVGKFKIKFLPSGKNFFGFVNAVEVFLAPPSFIPDSAPLVNSEGSMGDYNGLLLRPLKKIHRINVGGSNIMSNNDTLLRLWVPDDIYLINKNSSKNSDPYNGKLYYQITTNFDAPDSVYNTAKESLPNASDILWRFDVKKGEKYLVRLHFCDIVSVNSNEQLRFNLFIYGKFRHEVYPWEFRKQFASPFYKDFVVDSDDFGFLNISVGPRNDSDNMIAFLNGLEIFELITEPGSSEYHESDATKRHLLVIVGSCVGGVILFSILSAFLYFGLRKRMMKSGDPFEYGGSSHKNASDKTVSGSTHGLNLRLKIPFAEILYATKNFDNGMVIGEGGFGKVYKGTLRDGRKVAAKRSEPGHGQGLSEFQTEIILLSKIHHNNLVSLIGYCDERDEMILVYEFMDKGTLRDHLYFLEKESRSRSELSWDQRLGICIGAAKGIEYLHTGANGAIIHRDIKSTNILLDDQYVAKVADFGLSRSGPADHTHVSTNVKGSFGYFDPEYFICSQLTQKSDVFSFGVVLLEVLCARPVIDHSLPAEEVSLAEWGLSWISKGLVEKIVDPFLAGKINPDSLRKFGETVEKCLQQYGGDRPSMYNVRWDLEYCLELQRSDMPKAPWEDSTTDMSPSFQMNVLRRLPSHCFPMDEDSDASQVNAAGETFSQLKSHEAR